MKGRAATAEHGLFGDIGCRQTACVCVCGREIAASGTFASSMFEHHLLQMHVCNYTSCTTSLVRVPSALVALLSIILCGQYYWRRRGWVKVEAMCHVRQCLEASIVLHVQRNGGVSTGSPNRVGLFGCRMARSAGAELVLGWVVEQ